jgi:lysophospholipase L1-like esterase
VNLSRSDSFTADDFGDPVHLNARGAERFSQRLAEVLLSAQPIAE